MSAAEERAWNVLDALHANGNRLDTRFGFSLTAQLALAVYVASVLEGNVGYKNAALEEIIFRGTATLIALAFYLVSVGIVITDLFQDVSYKARSKRHALLLSDWDVKKGGTILPSIFITTSLADVAKACNSLVAKNDRRMLMLWRANVLLLLSVLFFTVFTSGLYKLT